jgi:hypothetical protein
MKISELKLVESEGVDLTQYEGEKNEIKAVDVVKVPSLYGEDGKKLPVGQAREAFVLKVSGTPLAKIADTDVAPTELFNLKVKDGVVVGWSSKGSLQKFLDKMGVKHPQDLIGKKAIVTLRKSASDGRDYLGFVTGK